MGEMVNGGDGDGGGGSGGSGGGAAAAISKIVNGIDDGVGEMKSSDWLEVPMGCFMLPRNDDIIKYDCVWWMDWMVAPFDVMCWQAMALQLFSMNGEYFSGGIKSQHNSLFLHYPT